MDDFRSFEKVVYLVAAALFILGLKLMSHPRTAARGNVLGAAAMTLAVTVALAGHASYLYIVLGIAVGGAIGGVMAIRVQMTAMPQVVALLNGFGGLASALVAGGALLGTRAYTFDSLVATGVSGLVGAVTFSGSIVAFCKLQELSYFQKPLRLPVREAINGGLVAMALLACLLLGQGHVWLYVPLVLLSLLIGYLLTDPIGGADMPVVIALLNSYSGVAAAATGFVIDNYILIITGALVASSGFILTQLMCKAMNRSLFNVLFGVMDAGSLGQQTDAIYATVRSTTSEDVAMILESAQRVVIIPGYGMAVAQAQHAVRDMAKLLERRGVNVEYGIHPVAGRMPGHMNVLLAEADIPYEKLRTMDDINPTMATADVAVVIGANDVVNPLARTDPHCPIAGMPIIDADLARTVIVVKRSLSPGFAGIPNPLFAAENTLLLFADAQQAILGVVAALKENG